MKTIRFRLIPTILLTGLCSIMLPACSSVAPGNDPAVVRAEQTIDSTFELADAFVLWERDNKAVVPPDVRVFADKFRDEFPDANRAARALLRTYKANRTPENKANLETALKTLEELKTLATKMLQLHQRSDLSGVAKSAAAISPIVVMAAIDGLQKLISLISAWIATAKRDKEWTPEETAAVDKKMEDAFAAAHWKKE